MTSSCNLHPTICHSSFLFLVDSRRAGFTHRSGAVLCRSTRRALRGTLDGSDPHKSRGAVMGWAQVGFLKVKEKDMDVGIGVGDYTMKEKG